MYALANEVERNYSNVHTDVGKLEEHRLVQRTPENLLIVPFDSVAIHLAVAKSRSKRKAARLTHDPRAAARLRRRHCFNRDERYL
jgi:predicted transcriptional regulator